MKHYLKKILICLGIFILLFSSTIYAHSGRTDSNGGHKDNQNKSGLGSYHYHCGGHPAHLHPNGICPYSSNSSSSSKSNNSSSSSSSSKSNSSSSSSSSNSKVSVPSSSTINAESIKINENIEELNIGESKQLTANILPSNTTDKKVIWKSSDESIVTITETGKITAKRTGIAKITASTSNGKMDSIQIYVKEEIKENYNDSENTLEVKSNVSNTINNNTESPNILGGIIILGVIGGGGYWIYKKYKK